MMENPRVDKKLLLSNFLSQFQMSEDCPSPMARHLQALQNNLRQDSQYMPPDYGLDYRSRGKKSFIDQNQDSLFGGAKDMQSSPGLAEYADLMEQMGKESPDGRASSIVDIEQIELDPERSRSSSRNKSKKTRPSTAHTTATNNRISTTSYNRQRKNVNNSRLAMAVRQDRSGSSLRSLAGISSGYATVKPKASTKREKTKEDRPSGKENDSTRQATETVGIAKAKQRKTGKRRDHNYSTSSSQMPTSSVVQLKKVLPGKVTKRRKISPRPETSCEARE